MTTPRRVKRATLVVPRVPTGSGRGRAGKCRRGTGGTTVASVRDGPRVRAFDGEPGAAHVDYFTDGRTAAVGSEGVSSGSPGGDPVVAVETATASRAVGPLAWTVLADRLGPDGLNALAGSWSGRVIRDFLAVRPGGVTAQPE